MMDSGVGTDRFLSSLRPCCTISPMLELWAPLVFALRCWENFGLFFFFFYGINSPAVNTPQTPSTAAQHWSRVQGGEGCASGPENGAGLEWAVASPT